jgi:hypothetical protein
MGPNYRSEDRILCAYGPPTVPLRPRHAQALARKLRTSKPHEPVEQIVPRRGVAGQIPGPEGAKALVLIPGLKLCFIGFLMLDSLLRGQKRGER